MNIIDFIPFGRKNAVSMKELSIRMRCDKRTVRAAVFNARIHGAVICSTCDGDSSDGYYRPVSAEEALPYVNMQRKRIESAKAALKSTEDYIKGSNVISHEEQEIHDSGIRLIPTNLRR